MNELQQTINSREVAKMVGRTHDNVLKDIRNIIKQIGAVKNHESYFIESTYLNAQNKELPCYDLTKKGCELYSTRMTGAKGTQFAVAYIEQFNEMEKALTQPKLPTNYSTALRELADQVEANERLQQQNAELMSRLSYTQGTLDLETKLYTTSEIAIEFGFFGANGTHKFYELLNNLKVVYPRKKKTHGFDWVLYANHQNKGYRDDRIKRTGQKWTVKGRDFVVEKVANSDAFKMIERRA